MEKNKSFYYISYISALNKLGEDQKAYELLEQDGGLVLILRQIREFI